METVATNTHTITNMSIKHRLMAFSTPITSFLSQLPPRSESSDKTASSSLPRPRSSPSIDDTESQAVVDPNAERHNSNPFLSQLPPRSESSDPPPSPSLPQPRSSPSIDDIESLAVVDPNAEQHNSNQFLIHWQNVVMAFCFTSALEISLLFAQTKSQLPVSFHCLSFVILLVFLSLFVAKFVGQKFTVTSHVLEKGAILLAATSFVLTITIPFPLKLKLVTWTLYGACLFIIVVCNKYKQFSN